MSGIKSIIKSTKYSDGSSPADWPPTYQDVQMRVKHTSDSVEYNLDHSEDHLAELVAQLGKLQGVDRGKAEVLAQKVCAYLDKVYAEVEKFKGHDGS